MPHNIIPLGIVSLLEAKRYRDTFRWKPIWAVSSSSCLRTCLLAPQKVGDLSVTGFYRILLYKTD